MVAIQTYETEQEHLARKNLQTPVSFIGSYKMIMPLAHGPASSTLARIAKYAGTALLLLLFWVFVPPDVLRPRVRQHHPGRCVDCLHATAPPPHPGSAQGARGPGPRATTGNPAVNPVVPGPQTPTQPD